MLLGTGIDIIEIERIKLAMETPAFARKFFTAQEIVYCDSRKSGRFSSYAARFAAKEAFVKALGTGFRGGRFREISIENDENGCPQVQLSGYYKDVFAKRKIKKIHVSLSHCEKYAVAQVILEGYA